MIDMMAYKLGQKRGGGSGGGAVSWNDLTDKPFYEEIAEITVADNLTVEGEEVEVQVFIPMAAITNVISVDVIFDNTKYQDVDIRRSGGRDWQGIWCGDYDTWEYPFVFSIESGGYDSTGLIVGVSNSDVAHTISIVVRYANIRHINPKYLPEALQFGEELQSVTVIDNQTLEFEEFTAAEGSGASADSQISIPVSVITNAVSIDVIFDNTTYQNIAIVRYGGEGYHGFDMADTEYSDYPFTVSMEVADGEGWLGLYTPLPAEAHTFSVIVNTQKVHTLDPKYLPDLTSPSGKKFKLTVDDSGTVSAVEVTE